MVRRSRPGCGSGDRRAQVWAALAEIPDPEIPVISLVDLGVVRDVAVDGERVHVEFTPTFLGCPALEVMRDADGGDGRARSAPSRTSRSSSTTRGRPTGSRPRAARSSAPPASRRRRRARRRAPTLVQLQTRGVPLPVLRLDRDAAREHLRPDPVPLDPLLRRAAASRSSSSRRSS